MYLKYRICSSIYTPISIIDEQNQRKSSRKKIDSAVLLKNCRIFVKRKPRHSGGVQKRLTDEVDKETPIVVE